MISIIITTYRPDKYIISCLDALAKQTISSFDFEVIIILNGQQFPYEALIKDLIYKYKFKINYFYTNITGVSNARNIGLKVSIGEYIIFLDDDDILSPNYLKTMLKKA